jgi:hypothetical protein
VTRFVVALLAVIVMAGCSGGGGNPLSPTEPPVATTPPPTEPTPPSEPPPLGPNETEIPEVTLNFGEPGAVFPITPQVSGAGALKFSVRYDRNSRIDTYVYSSEAQARACALLPETDRSTGALFSPACTNGGWLTTMTFNLDQRIRQVPGASHPTVWWGVFKNTDPSRAPFKISGKTEWMQ